MEGDMNDKKSLRHIENIDNYLAILVKIYVAQVIDQTITDEDEKKLYELTGVKSRNDICKKLHMSPNTVSDLWSSWYRLGLLKKVGNSYKKILE